jgi:hypothetical protein
MYNFDAIEIPNTTPLTDATNLCIYNLSILVCADFPPSLPPFVCPRKKNASFGGSKYSGSEIQSNDGTTTAVPHNFLERADACKLREVVVHKTARSTSKVHCLDAAPTNEPKAGEVNNTARSAAKSASLSTNEPKAEREDKTAWSAAKSVSPCPLSPRTSPFLSFIFSL